MNWHECFNANFAPSLNESEIKVYQEEIKYRCNPKTSHGDVLAAVRSLADDMGAGFRKYAPKANEIASRIKKIQRAAVPPTASSIKVLKQRIDLEKSPLKQWNIICEPNVIEMNEALERWALPKYPKISEARDQLALLTSKSISEHRKAMENRDKPKINTQTVDNSNTTARVKEN